MENLDHITATPTISDNLWSEMTKRLASFRKPRILEFGSGGSTLGFLRACLQKNAGYESFELTSFEHSPEFYDYMCSRISDTLKDSYLGKFTFSVYKLIGPRQKISDVVHDIRTKRKKYAVPPKYNTLGDVDNALLNPLRWAVKTADIINKKLCYLIYKKMTVLSYYMSRFSGHAVKKWEEKLIKENAPLAELPDYFKNHKKSCKYLIVIKDKTEKFQIRYHLLPDISGYLLWRRRDIDGIFDEFEDYVTFPLTGSFDIVYLDGRSRVSCAKRVLSENLLSEDGYIFMHDAYKDWYKRWLEDIYHRGGTFDGSNRRTDGSVLLQKPGKDPAAPTKDELLIFKNNKA